MRTRVLAVAAITLLACGGEKDIDTSALVGEWEGTKTFLDQNGETVGSAPGWRFQIVQDGLMFLRFVNGPKVVLASPTEFTISKFDYPPQAMNAPGGNCSPTEQSITGGTGTLEADGVLHVDLFWDHTCGGVTTHRRATFTMTRVGTAGTVGGSLL